MFKSLDMGVDWDLLHQQKLILLEMRQDQPDDSPEADAITGIVHLLDSLQDDAVGLGLWEFPGTAHAHDGGYVGDECCWGGRLKSSE